MNGQSKLWNEMIINLELSWSLIYNVNIVIGCGSSCKFCIYFVVVVLFVWFVVVALIVVEQLLKFN
jgi:hypothetical protein